MSRFDHSVRLARIDVTRMIRTNTDWGSASTSLLGVLMYVLLVGAGTLASGYLGVQIGQSLQAGTALFGIGEFSPAVAGSILGLFWVILTLVIAVRAVGQRGTLAQPQGTLTVVQTWEALLGVYLSEWVFLLLWVMAPAVGLGVGLAIGTATIWPVLVVPTTVVTAGASSVGIGYPLGLGIRHVASRFPFVVRYKSAIIVVVFLAYFLAISFGAVDRLVVALFGPIQTSPLAWYGDLLLLGTQGAGDSVPRAGGAVGFSVAVAALGVVVGTQIADRHWFSDPALASETPEPTARRSVTPGIERRLEPVLGVRTASLVTLSWRRAIRAPLKLLYAFFPVLALGGLFADVIQTGEIPAFLPYLVLALAAWSAGVVFTLNPLGDHGAGLAPTLLSGVSGRTFVTAHLIAGLAVAIPIGTLVTAIVAILSPIDRGTVVALVVATPIAMIATAAASIGIGMEFPRFEATNVTRSLKTVLPSRWAFFLFSAYLAITAIVAAVVYEPLAGEIIATLISVVLPFGLSVSADTVSLGAALAILPLAIIPVLSLWYAIERFDRYTLG